MNVREMLEACRTAVIEIAAIERQIERVTNIGGPRQVGSSWPTIVKVPGRNEFDIQLPGGDCSAQEEGLREMLAERARTLESIMTTCEALIRQLEDGVARTILRYYYGVAWTDERIADELGMPRQSVNARRNAAIGYLESIA